MSKRASKPKVEKRRSHVALAMILETRSTQVPNKKRVASKRACRNWKGE